MLDWLAHEDRHRDCARGRRHGAVYRDKGKGERVVAALAVRVVLSAALIGFLVLAYHLGWITPMGAR